MRISAVIALIAFLLSTGCSNSLNDQEFKGEFLGQSLPKDSAEIFGPELISTEFNVRDAALSPGGNEFFYSIRGAAFHSILRFVRKDNIWIGPEVAPFSGRYSDIEPCFSPDGRRLYFVSNRPLDNNGEPKDYDIWYVEKLNEEWGNPINLGEPVNTDKNEFYPSFTNDGTLYFCAQYEKGYGGEDLYYSKFAGGEFLSPKNLGDSVNTVRDEFNSFVSADGSFIIFTSMGWGTGFGGGDLWISFRKPNKEWSKPKNLGNRVNSPAFEYCPSLTPDGRYLFFTSNRSNSVNFSAEALTYSEIIDGLNSIMNGSQNIYWISAEFIKNLK
jgi:hypothetical protein